MSEFSPEFSRLVPLIWLDMEPFRQRIEATAEERQKLSERFELFALDRLAAEVELRRQSTELFLLEADFEAEFEQCCAVTLEPIRGSIADRFSLLYGQAKSETLITLCDEELAFEPLTGEAIDIGEAVAQELSLSLPEFPRHPDAMIDEFLSTEREEGPFAALARLRKSQE